ncbi:MAG: 50S ribosomal protein L25 [Rhabdochlamydiaceae bacterium]
MKLTVKSRSGVRKSEVNQARRAGEIPAILYAPGEANHMLLVNEAEFSGALRQIKQGQLPTTVFYLDFEGKEHKVVVKDIQYNPVNYKVIHLDFQLVKDTIKVKIPLTCVGIADCAGIKLGGSLRQVIRHLKAECPADHIPSDIKVDVKDLGIKQKKRLIDLVIPEGIKPLISLNEVVVVIAKK